jgi:hypothetical protein
VPRAGTLIQQRRNRRVGLDACADEFCRSATSTWWPNACSRAAPGPSTLDGDELVMPTFVRAPHVERPAARLAAVRAKPDVAICIDTESFPPHVPLVRGRAAITEVDGIAPEYALAARRYRGDEQATTYLGHADGPGTRMARIAVRPAWVGLIDFDTRLPEVMAR